MPDEAKNLSLTSNVHIGAPYPLLQTFDAEAWQQRENDSKRKCISEMTSWE